MPKILDEITRVARVVFVPSHCENCYDGDISFRVMVEINEHVQILQLCSPCTVYAVVKDTGTDYQIKS